MYSSELEKLIEFALIDGTLTSSEREILIKKAISFGIDRAEFELVLDAKIYQIKQKKNVSLNIDANQNAFNEPNHNNISKCSVCQSPVEDFTTSCKYCGSDLTNKKSNVSIQELFRLLNEAEMERKDDTNNPFLALGNFYANAFSQILGPSKIDRRKMEIIASFTIPTNKENIFEFLTLAIPRAKPIGNFFTKNNPQNKIHNEFVQVWRSKCEQVILKARLAMKDDLVSLKYLIELEKELKNQ